MSHFIFFHLVVKCLPKETKLVYETEYKCAYTVCKSLSHGIPNSSGIRIEKLNLYE